MAASETAAFCPSYRHEASKGQRFAFVFWEAYNGVSELGGLSRPLFLRHVLEEAFSLPLRRVFCGLLGEESSQAYSERKRKPALDGVS